MPGERLDLRIKAEVAQQRDILLPEVDIGVIGRTFDQSAADTLQDIAQGIAF